MKICLVYGSNVGGPPENFRCPNILFAFSFHCYKFKLNLYLIFYKNNENISQCVNAAATGACVGTDMGAGVGAGAGAGLGASEVSKYILP